MTRLSHFFVSSWERHLRDDALFALSQVLPRGPDVACWLMQSPWRRSLLSPPSLTCLEALALGLQGLKGIDICFSYQPFVLWAPILCRAENPGEGQPHLSGSPTLQRKPGVWAEGGSGESGGETGPAPVWTLAETHLLLWGTGPDRSFLVYNAHCPLCPAFLPGVQAREKQPAEPPAPLRRRAASDGQYENQSPEPASPRSPGVRSPVQCVSPELALTIALNPGGRPKEVSPWAASCGQRERSGARLNGLGVTVSPVWPCPIRKFSPHPCLFAGTWNLAFPP